MENSLLKQLPSLRAIQWEEDRRTLGQHYEARLRGETLGDDAEYLMALRRRARMLREKMKAAVDYRETPEILAESVSRLIVGRSRCAAGVRTRRPAIRAETETEPRAALPTLGDKGRNATTPVTESQHVIALADTEHVAESASAAEYKQPKTEEARRAFQRKVADTLQNLRQNLF